MIVNIKSINGDKTTSIEHLDSYIEELEFFQNSVNKFRETHNKILEGGSPQVRSYFHHTADTVVSRIIFAGSTIDALVILSRGGSILKKEWVFEDEVVENRQGGTTHNQGWILSGVAD